MKYRKRPVVIEAIQWNGKNIDEIKEYVGNSLKVTNQPEHYFDNTPIVEIRTLESGEGYHIAGLNDWIIKGVHGEFYPCKPDIFEKTYDPVY